ncbi:MAG: single-stranded-DNA-specific exonuclease RecJ [Nitrospirae bacterium]|nr:single-stranded-DNA-specific exonuclease RecJ [Nitrospirota bacterium]
MPDRRWFVQRTNPDYVRYLSRAASVSAAFAQILINRGINTPEDVRAFLDPAMERLSDPFDLPGMKEAVETVRGAIGAGRKIVVHGDYDADGLTGTAVMVSALRRLGAEVYHFIPERMVHGYGFNPPGVEYARRVGAGLIITVDCGISSLEAVRLAVSEGMGVVVTDHHEPVRDAAGVPVLPEADAVVNPRLCGDECPPLSGSAVAFKLASALLGPDASSDLIDLAALGTIADVIPLIDESRVIVRHGLVLINEGLRPGIKALKDVAGLNGRDVSAGRLAFTVIPRLNAAGRIDNPGEVVRLLLSADHAESAAIAGRLQELNLKRQGIEEEIYQEALSMLEEKGYDRTIVLASEGWHEGVVGIVAARLAEAFYRPAFVFNVRDGIAKGSARSIPPFDLYGGISRCRDMLLSFGGHRQAAGLKLSFEDLGRFEEAMNRIVAETLTEEDLVPTLTIDAAVDLREVNFGLVKELSLLEPLGCGNPEPVLGTKGLEVVGPRVVGNNHLKMRLRHRSFTLDAIGFSMGELIDRIGPDGMVDAVYTPAVNEWENRKSVQLHLRAFRPSAQVS